MNTILIKEFEKLGQQIRHELLITKDIKNSYRLTAINNLLDIIKKYPEEIKSSSQLKNIKGVGSHSLKRIDEILETGKLSEIHDNILLNNSIQELTKIYGIGDKMAYDLYIKYNIKTIEDLIKSYKNKKIKLSATVIKGLTYYNIVKENIPREEIDKIDNLIHEIVRNIDIELFYVICGSYRRMKDTSGDIDIIITHPNTNMNYLSRIIKEFKKHNFIVDSLTSDNTKTKYMGYCKYKNNPVRRLDMRFIPYNSYYCALMYFTGSKDFNRKIRHIANTLGYTLNEYNLIDSKNNKIVINSELDIFKTLGLEYVNPEYR
jgi:DNA polymerase beta